MLDRVALAGLICADVIVIALVNVLGVLTFDPGGFGAAIGLFDPSSRMPVFLQLPVAAIIGAFDLVAVYGAVVVAKDEIRRHRGPEARS